nr:NADH dehydrogenase subunit 2 [Mileewa rufivena]
MKLNLTNMLFYYTMMMGTMISISSNNWMMMWGGLEISLMSFIPLMSGGVMGSESSMKYFIVQSISSSMLVLAIMLTISMNMKYNYILMISLIMKMGIAPFHNWVLSIVNSLNYNLMLVLFTIMKIAPLVMLSYLNYLNNLFIVLSLIIGSCFSLNQNSIRKLLAYSSIYNMAYMLSVINMNYIWTMYLLTYSTILCMLIYMINKLKINYINQFSINEFSILIKSNLWMTMLSLGGMPPLMGFFPKLMIFQILIMKKMFILLTMMILTSLMVMFFYMRMVFMSFINYSMLMKQNLKYLSNLTFLPLIMNTSLFPILISIKYLM